MKYLIAIIIFGFSNIVRAESICPNKDPQLDHILWAVPDLEEYAKKFEDMTGVKPKFGGVHTTGATANYLVSLGDCLYFEIYGPAKNGVTDDTVRSLRQQTSGKINEIAIRSSDLEALAGRAKSAKIKYAGPRDGGRDRPDGVKLRWAILDLDTEFGGLTPFVIDWKESPHPSVSNPKGITLKTFTIFHPRAEELREVYEALGIGFEVKKGPREIVAILNTPKGDVRITSRVGN